MTEVLTPVPRDLWRSIHRSDPMALTDQSPEWVDAICAEGRHEDVSRLYEMADGRQIVMPLVRCRGAAGLGGRVLSPPEAWGMGGPIGHGVDRGVIDMIMTDLRSLGALRIGIRPDPVTAPLWTHLSGPGMITIPRFAHVIDLEGGIEAVESRFTKSTHKNINKAVRRGVTVELDHSGALLPVHYEMYMRSVERWSERQHEPLALARWRARRRDPLSKLQTMADHLGEGFCHFVAYHEGRHVASAIVLLSPGSTAHVTRGAMHRELVAPVAAGQLLDATAIRYAVQEGCTRFHMGESGTSSSLAKFKEGFGAVGHHYAEYRFERLPITRVDRGMRAAIKRTIGFKDA